MTIIRIGVISPEKYKARTMAIARGELKPKASDPKVWFTSIGSVAKVLSESNRELLAVIAAEKPQSLKALSDRLGRAPSNVSRTLKTMERYGLVRLEPKGKRGYVPRAVADRVSLDLSLSVEAG